MFKITLLFSLVLSVMLFSFFRPAGQSDAFVQIAAPNGNPVELGDVRWLRDLDAGVAQAKKEDKPLLILFQEVPGCANCTRYGSVTLTHPLIVEAIETYFVPVCIYNNEKGKDAAALKIFNEPAWNNPVVRIVTPDYEDIVPRMADFRSNAQIVEGMTATLRRFSMEVPEWLKILQEELSAQETGVKTATFAMHCFWTGESAYGNMPGVIGTEAGWQDGKEVVKVMYNPLVTSEARLGKPSGTQVTACKNNEGFKTDREPKYYLSKTDYRFLPMTPLQQSRANSLVGSTGASIDFLLSPRQKALFEQIKMHPKKAWNNCIEAKDFTTIWKKAVAL